MVFKKLISLFFILFFCSSAHSENIDVAGVEDAQGVAFNTTFIPGAGYVCGDGVINPNEVCDSSTLPSGATCVSLGFASGPLTCASNCLSFNTSACIPVSGDNNYINVMFIGDSHTYSSTNQPNYYTGGFRYGYQRQLLPKKINALGNFKDPYPLNSSDSHWSQFDPTLDLDHAGVGGQTTEDINNRVPSLISTYMSSSATCGTTIIIYEGGYNGLGRAKYKPYSVFYAAIGQTIDRFYANCPNNPFIVVNLIPNDVTGPPTTVPYDPQGKGNAAVIVYNDGLSTFISNKQQTIPNLWFVDMYAEFNKPTNITTFCSGNMNNCLTLGDTSHPGNKGYDLEGYVLGQIGKNGCSSTNSCRPNPLP